VRKLFSSSTADWVAVALFLVFTVAGSLVALNRYWQYEVFYYDFGIFDTAIWKVSQFQPPIIDHLVVGGKLNLADHFTPGLYLLSPLYWFTDKQEILFIAQAFAVGLGGFVLYATSKKILQNGWYSIAVMMTFFCFVGLQNAVITDIHESTFMVLPLSLMFWAVAHEHKKMLLIAFAVVLSLKESTFLFGMAFSLYLFFVRKSWWKEAVGILVCSILYGMIVIQVVIPFFSKSPYQYMPEFPKTPSGLLLSFVNNEVKRDTLLTTFRSFGFLPLFAPHTWLLIGQDFLTRFAPLNTGTRWTLGLHYSAQLSVFMVIGTIYTLRLLLNEKRVRSIVPFICLLLVLNAMYLHQFVKRGPLGLAYNPAFYRHTASFSYIDEFVALVPRSATIMTQNNLAPHFTHHKTVWLLRGDTDGLKPDYVLLDVREGQNGNNFFGSPDPSPIWTMMHQNPAYEVVKQTEKQALFKRKES
jgi:uncharacterized membrane protein